jgi:hypothetical protein
MGDPGIVYFIVGALSLQLLGLAVYVRAAKKRRLFVAALYSLFFGFVWTWALDSKSVSVETAGWILNVLPLALLLIRWFLLRKRPTHP